MHSTGTTPTICTTGNGNKGTKIFSLTQSLYHLTWERAVAVLTPAVVPRRAGQWVAGHHRAVEPSRTGRLSPWHITVVTWKRSNTGLYVGRCVTKRETTVWPKGDNCETQLRHLCHRQGHLCHIRVSMTEDICVTDRRQVCHVNKYVTDKR